MTRFAFDAADCRRCGARRPRDELDRDLWCPTCAAQVRARARRWGRGAGLVAAVALALWTALVVRPAAPYRWWWVLPVLLTYLLVARIVAAVVLGIERSRGVRSPPAGENRPDG
jgi:hypothetical protein